MHRRNVRRAGVDELAVDLVGKQVEVIFLYQIAYLVHLLLGIEVARRVVRVADEDGLRVFVNQLLELLHLRQAETFFDGRGDRTDYRSRRDGEGHIVRIGRFRDYYLVARIKTAHEGEKHRLATTCRDDDLIGMELDLVALVIAHQSLP